MIDEHGSTYFKIKDGVIDKTMLLPNAEVLIDIDKGENILGIEILNVKVGKSKKKSRV